MLKPLILTKTQLTPKVVLDKENNFFVISGKSIFSDGHEFFKPILKWFEEYFKNPNSTTELTLFLEYINSSSFLQITILINLLVQHKNKSNIKILWLYDEDDETMQEAGKEFQYSTTLNIELVEIKE